MLVYLKRKPFFCEWGSFEMNMSYKMNFLRQRAIILLFSKAICFSNKITLESGFAQTNLFEPYKLMTEKFVADPFVCLLSA